MPRFETPQDLPVDALSPPAKRLSLALPRQATWALLIAGLFLSYPLATFIPFGCGFPLVFHLSLPFDIILALAAALHFVLTPIGGPPRHRRLVLGGLGLFTLLVLAGAYVGHSARITEIVAAVAPVILVVWVAVAGPTGPRRLDRILALLWGLQILHCTIQVATGSEPVALAGNRNWAATLLAVLAPWVCFRIQRLSRAHTLSAMPIWALLAQVFVVLVTLFFVVACHCRATWLALAVYGVVIWMFRPCSWPGRILLAVAGLVLSGIVLLNFPGKCADILERDIRVPLYINSIRLIMDHPVLGVGAGNFRRDFVRYRSVAQSARAVSAPVTDHPHNELLHVAGTLGLPAALLWALVFFGPLFLPIGSNPTRRLLYYSLWMLMLHGMLDKVLVQPPTSLLAALFAGMLWRPCWRLRLRPRSRRCWQRWCTTPAFLAFVFLALFIGIRHLRVGQLFRRAYLAETEGHNLQAAGQYRAARRAFEKACAAYETACRWSPRDVRAHAFAGICANNKLHDPSRALPHIQAAMQLERDYAHLNGEAGLALGSLRRHEEAFPFFVREAQLFPYDITAIQRLIVCASATGRYPMLPELHTRLMALSVRRVEQRLGTRTMETRVMALRDALARNAENEGLSHARALVSCLETGTVEAPLADWLDPQILAVLRGASFTRFDWEYWRRLERLRVASQKAESHSPKAMLRVVSTIQADQPGDDPFAPARQLLELAPFFGFSAACLQAGNTVPTGCIFELRQGSKTWLLDRKSGIILVDTGFVDLITNVDLRQRLGLPANPLPEPQAVVSADPLQFFYRTQALGAMIEKTGERQAVPHSTSPMTRAITLQMTLQEELQQHNVKNDAITVRYDQKPAKALQTRIAAIRKQGGDARKNSPAAP